MSGMIDANTTEWPCVGESNSPPFKFSCAVCSLEKPCLFDIAEHADPSERINREYMHAIEPSRQWMGLCLRDCLWLQSLPSIRTCKYTKQSAAL